ncbi:MAG: SH3 domain-containing protein [Cyanobacteria bacterium J06635_15]
MNQNLVRLLTMLGIVPGMLLILAPKAPAQPQPGWQDWEQINPSNTLPFAAGFSNLELGGYLDFEQACEQAASEANTSITYWYRLSDLVWKIGTGPVEQGCRIGDTFVATSHSTAVLSGLASPVCLTVQSDIGNGLRVRAEPTLLSRQLGALSNGTETLQENLPALIVTDTTGRLWLSVQQDRLAGWASLANREGGYVNFRMCSPLARLPNLSQG